jgi:hypothetical protein
MVFLFTDKHSELSAKRTKRPAKAKAVSLDAVHRKAGDAWLWLPTEPGGGPFYWRESHIFGVFQKHKCSSTCWRLVGQTNQLRPVW